MFIHFLAALNLVICSWLAPCSCELSASRGGELFRLTGDSIYEFAARLRKSDPSDPLVAELRNRFATGDPYRRACLKYLIASVAVLGQADADAMARICGLCSAARIGHLWDLLCMLADKNCRETVVTFATERNRHLTRPESCGELIAELVEESWGSVKALIMEILDVLRRDESRCDSYYFLLRHLPIEQQYEMIRDGSLPLSKLGDVYCAAEFYTLLREIFALARCSYNPDPAIREYIANVSFDLNQFLPDSTIKGIVHPCPDNIPQLHSDVWCRIFVFMDAETLTFVLPLVCTHWRDLHPRVMSSSTKIHDLYVCDLNNVELSKIRKIAPWRHYILSDRSALAYLGYCIADDALHRTNSRPTCSIRKAVTAYVNAVTSGEVHIPKVGGCKSLYDSFLALFETAHTLCAVDPPVLDKPHFFTDEEHGRVIRYFMQRKRGALKLSYSLITSDMPRIFSLAGEDEELMVELITNHLGNFTEASIALIISSQASELPAKLAKLVFSRTELFAELVKSDHVHPAQCYTLIVDHHLLTAIMLAQYWTPQFPRLVAALVLFFKDDPEKIAKILSSIVLRLPHLDSWWLESARQLVKAELSELSGGICKRSTEDINFVKKTMAKLGWWSEPTIM